MVINVNTTPSSCFFAHSLQTAAVSRKETEESRERRKQQQQQQQLERGKKEKLSEREKVQKWERVSDKLLHQRPKEG